MLGLEDCTRCKTVNIIGVERTGDSTQTPVEEIGKYRLHSPFASQLLKPARLDLARWPILEKDQAVLHLKPYLATRSCSRKFAVDYGDAGLGGLKNF